MPNRPDQQVMVFVDAGYVYGVMRTFYGVSRVDDLTINYEALAELLRSRVESEVGPVLRIRWYDATDPTRRITNPRAMGMANVAGVRLVEGRLVTRQGVVQQKAVDTRLVADMLTIAYQRQVDRLVVITGDEDMVPGFEAAEDLGLHVEVWSVEGHDQPPTVSRELVALADRHRTIDIADVEPIITPIRDVLSAIAAAPLRPESVEPGVVEPGAVEPGVVEPGVVEPSVAQELAPASPTPSPAPAAEPADAPVPKPHPRQQPPVPQPAPPAPHRLDPPNLWSTDQAAYFQLVDWDAEGDITDYQRAARVGAVYARRWWSAASENSRVDLTSIRPDPKKFGRVPPQIDKDLLRFAEDNGIDTWGQEWAKVQVRDGFWDAIGGLSAAE